MSNSSIQVFLTTTGATSPVTFSSLGGVSFVHPTTNLALIVPDGQFDQADIIGNAQLQAAVTGGDITLTDADGNNIDVTDPTETSFVSLTLDENVGGIKRFQENIVVGDQGFTSVATPPYTISVQDENFSYIELLTNNTSPANALGGADKGGFVCLENNGNTLNDQHFALYNFQGGPIIFYTDTTASSSVERLRIEPNGTLNVAGTTTYELLVTDDDDIPNKKYVDDTVSGGAPPASESVAGIAELATQGETDTGTDDLRIVTPLKLANASGVVHTTGDETVAGEKTFTNDIIKFDPASASTEWELGFFPSVSPTCFGLRSTGLSGYFCFMPNADNPQIVLGNPANTTGAAFIDVDNNRPMNINVLDTGAGTPAVVNIGTGGLNINNPGNLTTGAGSTITFGGLTNGLIVGDGSGVLGVSTLTEADIVESSAVITDNAIVRGDGGAKGIQESGWTIADDDFMSVSLSRTGYALDVTNTLATGGGNGFHICGGELLGDIALRVCDADDSFTLMEIEADQGFMTLGETYAQTLIDNGVVYGVDNQHGGDSADFNTQSGQYRIAGTAIPLKLYELFADQVDITIDADWAVSAGAVASVDTNNGALTVRRFDDTTEEGIGFLIQVPKAATEMTVRTKARAETAPGGAVVAVPKLYKRAIPDDGAIAAWTSPNALTNIDLPTNELYQYDETNAVLATWGLTAGELYQFQLTRDAGNGSDTLVGDLTLVAVEVEFN